MIWRLLREAALPAAVAGFYFVAGKIGLSLAQVNPSASAVWPPTGIALAALLVLGSRIWPGIFLGAFLVNATTSGHIPASLTIAAGNTAEGLLGAYLVQRFSRGRQAFDQPHNIFKYARLVMGFATSTCATIGTVSLCLAGLATWSRFGDIWVTWWLGDSAGALVVSPFLILWSAVPRLSWSRRQYGEACLLVAALGTVGWVVFGNLSLLGGSNFPLSFLPFPILAWAAFRFTQREASTAMVILSLIATWGTLRGFGPFGNYSPNEALLLLQGFMAVTSVMILAVAAAVADRRRVEASIRQLNAELEERVSVRTQQILLANLELRRQIEERGRDQAELEKSEARLREAQQVARMGSWEWDIERNELWWSKELYAIYGLDSGSVGTTYEAFLERVHPDDRELTRRVLETAVREKIPFSFEHRIIRFDGNVLTLQGRGRVITDENGRPVRMMGAGYDVTDQKRAEEERSQLIREQTARREAEEANRKKDEFLATLSHELRTPLNAIVGWAQLLREGGLDAETAARAVETISRNAQIQSHLISDILDISRIAVGGLEFKRQPVPIATVIEGALDTMRPAAQAKNISLQSRMEPIEKRVVGDPDRLQQVIWNLLSNAIKFAPDGGVVSISLKDDGSEARIQVEDDGPGIDSEFLPYVFERFRQRDSSDTRRHGGLGLGLAIVKHLTEYHGGRVSADNRENGSGALFTVTLPLAEPSGARTGDPRAKHDPAPAAGASRSGKALEGVRVLLVEDNADSRELLAMLLSHCGAEVHSVSSSPEALAVLPAQRFDVLVSDIEMPGENGYEFIAKVRSLPGEAEKSIPAIALTAHAGAEDAIRAIRAGFHAHASKPIQLNELVSLIADLAASGRSRPTPQPMAPSQSSDP